MRSKVEENLFDTQSALLDSEKGIVLFSLFTYQQALTFTHTISFFQDRPSSNPANSSYT